MMTANCSANHSIQQMVANRLAINQNQPQWRLVYAAAAGRKASITMRAIAQNVRDFLILAGLVSFAALLLTVAFYGAFLSSPEFVRYCSLIASGPVGGWYLAAQEQSIWAALWSLLPLSILTFGPLLMAGRYPMCRIRWFVVAGIFWLVAGILYGVAIWI